jgi:hypothetical protein
MYRYAATLFRLFIIAVVAVCISGPAVLADDCPDTKPATYRGPIAPNGPWIAYQCPEACGGGTVGGTFVRHSEDPWLLDWIYVWCPGGYEVGIPATSTCWNCIDGCAGANCPPGELCMPIARQGGSDCIRYGCDDPAYELVETSANGVPYCRRKDPCPPVQHCTPATVILDGPTTIRPGTSCTWSTEAFSECTGAAYTYHWYVANHWAGSGQYYSGGRPSGVLIGSSWKVRVEVLYNGSPAGSKEITVKESSTARICMN